MSVVKRVEAVEVEVHRYTCDDCREAMLDVIPRQWPSLGVAFDPTPIPNAGWWVEHCDPEDARLFCPACKTKRGVRE